MSFKSHVITVDLRRFKRIRRKLNVTNLSIECDTFSEEEHQRVLQTSFNSQPIQSTIAVIPLKRKQNKKLFNLIDFE